MQEIVEAIDRNLIKQELNQNTFLRHTNNGNNEVYLINDVNAPNTLLEVGRLREITFRGAGGGTGLSVDIDENDRGEDAYDQLVVWNPEDEELVAGYRLIKCSNVGRDSHGNLNLSTTHYFHFSDTFLSDYLPYTIELGRSWVQPRYQPAVNNRKGIFSLDNLWDGLGAIVRLNPEVKYLFGKVTMYPQYNTEARDLLLYFMQVYFPDRDHLVTPINPVLYKGDITPYLGIFDGLSYKEGYKVLNGKIRNLGENIPPLINTYMNLSPTMKSFGTANNDDFGGVEETGILITIEDVYPTKKERHITTFAPETDVFAGKRPQ